MTFVFSYFSCQQKQDRIELKENIPNSLKTVTYVDTSLNFSLEISDKFKRFDGESDDTIRIEILKDTTMDNKKGADLFSVLKYNCSKKNVGLSQAWKILSSNRILIQDYFVISKGYSNFLNYPAYYEHASYTISNNKLESISFLFRCDSSLFYGISLNVNARKNYPDNLIKLLYYAKSFESVNCN